MGLLTDPSSDQGKLTKFLLKYYSKLCVLLYISGVIWFISLASPLVNSGTYFSENALLPGLVKSTFREDRLALQYFQELQDESQKYESSIPYSWILAKFHQIGLDAYTHNFSIRSPLNKNDFYTGKNVYGILRAPRASSTEALVLSVPYRAPSSPYTTTLASIAVQLAFAKFAVKEKYWAKDLIFLITDHEQLSIQAWLEAYHGVTCGTSGILNHGKLRGRAGAIQAAINLELHSHRIGQIDIKIEGLNGQLPNLDLFNLAGKICIKEGVFHTFKGKTPHYHKDPYREWFYYFKNMLSMMATQATGIPNGNHGLFLRFGIQALTMEGFEHGKGGSKSGFLTIGRVIEGIFRSMNNLLERFHQSFFFYLLPSYDRYISIGLYMPAICMMSAALIIKACAKWCKMQEENQKISYISVIVAFVLIHIIGAITVVLPDIVKSFNFKDAHQSICIGLISIFIIPLIIPIIFKKTVNNLTLLNIFSLLELGTALICLSMNNISLGIFSAIIIVPIALIIEPVTYRFLGSITKFLWILVHPLILLFLVIFINTLFVFSQETYQIVAKKAATVTGDAIVFSIIDSMIYGNWLYTVVCTIYVPNWIAYWYVLNGKSKPKQKDD